MSAFDPKRTTALLPFLCRRLLSHQAGQGSADAVRAEAKRDNQDIRLALVVSPISSRKTGIDLFGNGDISDN
jgi:hypothetical protein